MPFDVHAARTRFPALRREVAGETAAYLDGPGGTQVPDTVIASIASALEKGISNLGGPFAASEEAGGIVTAAREALADLFGGAPDEVVFGPNMTTLTFACARAVSAEWSAGDRVAVTALDHDANVSPWRLAAARSGADVDVVEMHPEDGTLDMDSLAEALDRAPRLLAVTAASNALGTITPLREIVAMAKSAGTQVYVDAVHYSAHRISDVRSLGADFVAASTYKFFGPHLGALWVAQEHRERLSPDRVAPAPSLGPGRWETGTKSFEALAGATAAVEYLASLGEGATRREQLRAAFASIGAHEADLASRFLTGVAEIGHVRIHGITDHGRLDERAATFAVEVDGHHPADVAGALGEKGIFVWHGDYYAPSVMERLDMAERGGLVRVGFVHYNTTDEVDRVLRALDDLASG